MTTDTAPTFDYETDYGTSGYVIGVDEAGRGPWAGPVCASAFWINPNKLATIPAALTDSKKLSAKKRAEIEIALKNGPHHFTAAMASVGEIDELGILQANFKAMAQAIDALADTLLSQDPLGLADKGLCQISCVLIDGNLKPKDILILARRLSKVMAVFYLSRPPLLLQNKHVIIIWPHFMPATLFMDGIAIKAMAPKLIVRRLHNMA